mgnify:CR=1 FL=1
MLFLTLEGSKMTSTEAVRMGNSDFRFFSQSHPDWCGVAAVRSVLASQFKQQKSEKEILQRIYRFYQKKSEKSPKEVFTQK